MHRQNVYLATIVCFLALTACEFKNEVHGPTEESPGPVETKNTKSDAPKEFVQVSVSPTAKPERYTVYMSWPQLTDSQQMRVRLGGDLTVLSGEKTFFTHEVAHNQTLLYQLEVLDLNQRILAKHQKQIKIPRDLWVKAASRVTLVGSYQVERLFLDSRSVLQVGIQGLDLTAKEILSDQATIESFPPGTKAVPGSKGRSAGEVKIKSTVARGTLHIHQRGEHGGDGFAGEPYSSRASDGHQPTDGILSCECRSARCDKYYSLPVTQAADHLPLFQNCHCSSYGSPGGPGGDGLPGRSGSPALDGGAGGKITVQIQDGSDFDLFTESLGGEPGTPGPGGPGQPGGLGGRLGDEHRCSGRFGTDGKTGPTGPVGAKASFGKAGQICVFIASENRNECR